MSRTVSVRSFGNEAHRHNITTQTSAHSHHRTNPPSLVPHIEQGTPTAPTTDKRTPDLPKFDRIILWAKDNAPGEVAKIEAHRGTVTACCHELRF